MEEDIIVKSLIIEVMRMRLAQKEFFKTHAASALTNAKEHERNVDSLLKNFTIHGDTVYYQPSLF